MARSELWPMNEERHVVEGSWASSVDHAADPAWPLFAAVTRRFPLARPGSTSVPPCWQATRSWHYRRDAISLGLGEASPDIIAEFSLVANPVKAGAGRAGRRWKGPFQHAGDVGCELEGYRARARLQLQTHSNRVTALETELQDARERLAKTTRSAEDHLALANATMRQAAAARERADEAEAELFRRRHDDEIARRTAAQAISHAETEAAASEARLKAVLESKSWRLTGLLRAAIGRFRTL